MSIPGPMLTIQVQNIPELVAKQGGNVGKVAFMAAPQTITNKVYSEMKTQMLTKFKEQGVDADVNVLAAAPDGKPVSSRNDLLVGLAAGGLAVGLIALVVHMVKK